VCVLAAAVYRDPGAEIPGWIVAATPAGRGMGGPGGDAAAPPPPAVYEIEQGLPSVTGDEQADRAAVRPGFLAVVRSRDILLLGLAAMFLCMVEFAALAHLVLFLHLDWAYSVVAAAGLLALCQAAGAFGKPLSGLVSDRLLGRRRKAPLLVLAGLAGLSCAMLALIGPGRTWLLWVALLMLGVGAVGWGGLFGTLAGETAGPAAAGAAAGVTAAIDNVGIFIGPPLFGLIVDRTGSYTPAWWTMVGAAALAACLLALVREPRRG
jgi:MFS transporter, ACS family, hexuronate transporter